jgi:di/tricarboxylate transporter
LIPLSYAAILGGTLTLVGTSTNLLVNSIMQNYGDIKPLGMFEFTKFGVLTLIVGLIYIVTMGNRLLPSRTVTSSLTKSYHLGGYLTEMKISKESPLVDRTCMERSLNHNYDIIVLDILRNSELITSNIRNTKLKEGDILFIRGSVDSFLRLKTIEKLSMLTDEKLNQSELVQENNVLVECLLTNKSELIGTSLMAANFRRRFGSFVLAIRREGTIIRKKLAYIILRAYDTLLVYGSREKVQEMASTGDFIILEELETSLKKHKLWWLSSILIIAVMLLSALGIVPILKGAIIAVVILLTLKVISPVEAYNSIHWQVIVLIATLIPLGYAIQTSGTADWIGNNIIILVRLFPDQMQPRMLLALIYLLTIILTETSSNAATAIIVTPIAIVSSINLGLDPRPFIFAVCFAASASFITPIGYQTNLMVYGPGGYKFKDFIRVGFPLSVIIWILGIIFIPVFWPFHLQ